MSSPFRITRGRSNPNRLHKTQQADLAPLEGLSKYRILSFRKRDTSRRSSLARYRLLRAYTVRHNLQPRRIRDLVSIAAYYDDACFPVISSESPISPITAVTFHWKHLALRASPERNHMKKAPNSTFSPPSSPTCITAASTSRMPLASNRPALRSRLSFTAVCEPVLYTAVSSAVPFPYIDSSHCSTPVTPDQQVLPMPLYPPSPLRTRAQPEKPRKFSSLWTCSPASSPASVSRSVRRFICDDTPIESLTECISLLSTQDHFSMLPRRLSYSHTTLSPFRPLRALPSRNTQNLQPPVLIRSSNTLESSRCFPFVGAAASRYY
ncbi:hypothetical protein EDD18DRAFT_1136086 [Armillaria luteobubalina]|uniref:Uncharacterized protein n=1 Tax=Armillaria luteobubalina TaxID=153913 RepID=A0AA39QK08_9AGAR|nr:hypothetical protein EDD18DRAFT_1136086 [Armillaria luteobubalina]